MSTEAPRTGRSHAIEMDFDPLGDHPGEVELTRIDAHSSDGDSHSQELLAAGRKDRRRRRRSDDHEEAAEVRRSRRRRVLVVALAALPLLASSAALVAVLTSETMEASNRRGALSAASGGVLENAAALQAASDVPTYSPSAVMTDRPTLAEPVLADDGPASDWPVNDGPANNEQQGELRLTPSPSAAAAAPLEGRPDLLMTQQAHPTGAPVPLNHVGLSWMFAEPFPTYAPSPLPSTGQPTEAGCGMPGSPCPKKGGRACCSRACEKDQDTGERVCAVNQQADTCVASGLACPTDKKLCCSGRCSGRGSKSMKRCK